MNARLSGEDDDEVNVDSKQRVSVQVNRRNDSQNSDLYEDDILKLMETKVDKTELYEHIKMKTNKSDTEMQMKAIDIMHRMLNHISVIITDILKQQLNQQNETKVVIEN